MSINELKRDSCLGTAHQWYKTGPSGACAEGTCRRNSNLMLHKILLTRDSIDDRADDVQSQLE